MNLTDITILKIHHADYCCIIINRISKSPTINVKISMSEIVEHYKI